MAIIALFVAVIVWGGGTMLLNNVVVGTTVSDTAIKTFVPMVLGCITLVAGIVALKR